VTDTPATEGAIGRAGCLDANALAGLAEGRLDEAERDQALAHLVVCPDCRDVASELTAHVEAAPPARAARRGWRTGVAAAAAAVLVAFGVHVATRTRGGGDAETRDRLVAAARDLSKAAPGLRLDPLTDAELAVRDADLLRGDGDLASPRGKVLDPRPTFAWPVVPGARTYAVTLLDATGRLWREETTATELRPPDPLAPGASYVWTLEADDPLSVRTTAAFEVVPVEEAAAWARLAAEAERRVPAPLASLLLAHAALRQDLAADALEHAERYARAAPHDPLAARTLERARDRWRSR
jgi:hypothetical protein